MKYLIHSVYLELQVALYLCVSIRGQYWELPSSPLVKLSSLLSTVATTTLTEDKNEKLPFPESMIDVFFFWRSK